MFICEDMVDMGLNEGQEWSSDIHRAVSAAVCIGNPKVTTLDVLKNNVQIINTISENEIKKVSGFQLIEMGCDI